MMMVMSAILIHFQIEIPPVILTELQEALYLSEEYRDESKPFPKQGLTFCLIIRSYFQICF
jgi:hypothetical protein